MRDVRVLVALLETLGRLHPQFLAKRAPLVRQPTPLGVPDGPGIPQGSWAVSPTETTPEGQ
jgi:hypothetical protein